MSEWWVRTETDAYAGHEATWYGPFASSVWAEQEAKRLSCPHDAGGIVAEVIFGERRNIGKRMAEYYLGQEFPTGGSGWYDRPPPEDIAIPE